jgi:hypothetical protein
MNVSKAITDWDIIKQNCFSVLWLKNQGLHLNFKASKLTQNRFFASFMNWLTPTKRTFNGHNTSCFKSDIIAVNGFNEDMQYGGLDREVGERMFNNGLFSKQIRYSAVCVHLDHARGYYSQEGWDKNLAMS